MLASVQFCVSSAKSHGAVWIIEGQRQVFVISTLFRESHKLKETHILKICIMQTSASMSHPSLIMHLSPPAGPFQPPRLMYALHHITSDREEITLLSAGLVFRPPSIIAAMSPIPRGGVKWNEYKILPGAFYMQRNAWLMCCSGMDTVVETVLFHCYSPLPKTMTTVHCCYFSSRWQCLWWNILLILQDLGALFKVCRNIPYLLQKSVKSQICRCGDVTFDSSVSST